MTLALKMASSSPADGGAPAAPARRVDDPSNTKPILLTLPSSDLLFKEKSGDQKLSVPTAANANNNASANEQLLLVQLPAKSSDITLSELASGRAYIVGPGPNDDADDDDVGGGASGASAAMQAQACLVIEGDGSKGKGKAGVSYSLSKVETSNALVMVPPQKPVTVSLVSNKSPGKGGEESPPKKQKTAENKLDMEMQLDMEMHAQLLEPGGSGASFLDLRPHPLNVGLFRMMLQNTVYDPYSNSGGSSSSASNGKKGGKTIVQLASTLRVSQSQVRHALIAGPLSSEAFQLPPRNSGKWGTLSEEAREDACMGIVAVLAECEEYANTFSSSEGGSTVGKDIVIDDFVKEVVRRSAEAEGDGTACLDAVVVEHCLRCCSAASDSEDDDASSNTTKLDMDKIALILAHHLFNSQTAPWSMTKFQSEWQRLMPCVGEPSMPNVELLAGVALQRTKNHLPPSVVRALIDKTNNEEGADDDKEDGSGGADTSNEIYLTYLPEHRLSTSPEKRFEVLFREKDRWTADELQPYVKRVADEAGSSVEEVLMKHTLSMEEGGIKIYTKRA